MLLMEKAILKLLQNNISFNNKRVPVIRRNLPLDKTPCITINQAANVFQSRDIINNPLETIRYQYNSQVWINVWCNTEEERHEIIRQIHLIFNQAIANHYLRCNNYEAGICSYLESACQALTVVNSRTNKNQCPYPAENHYCSFFKHNNILKSTFSIGDETDMDELDIDPPVLRTIVKVDMDYYTYYTIGGELIDKISIEDLI